MLGGEAIPADMQLIWGKMNEGQGVGQDLLDAT
jgi:hypothetical protein